MIATQPSPQSSNRRDAFSHSEQCNALDSGPVVTHPGYSELILGKPCTILVAIPGLAQSHTKCRCWCHNTQSLFSTSKPEYDLSPPPEYLSSADRAFMLDEATRIGVGSNYTDEAYAEDLRDTAIPVDPAMPRSQLYAPALNVDGPERFNGFNGARSQKPQTDVWLGDLISGDVEPGATVEWGAGNSPEVSQRTPPVSKMGFAGWSSQELRLGKCGNCGDALTACDCVE